MPATRPPQGSANRFTRRYNSLRKSPGLTRNQQQSLHEMIHIFRETYRLAKAHAATIDRGAREASRLAEHLQG